MVIDPTGAIVARSRVPSRRTKSGRPPGVAEQDAEVYWRALGEACRAVWALPGCAPRRDRRNGAHDAARHRRRDRPDGTTAAARDRLARPPPHGGPAVHRRRDRARIPGARPRTRSAASWPTRKRTGSARTSPRRGPHPPLSLLRVPDPSADRAASSTPSRRRSASSPSTTSARRGPKPATGGGPRPPSTRRGCPSSCPPTQRWGR